VEPPITGCAGVLTCDLSHELQSHFVPEQLLQGCTEFRLDCLSGIGIARGSYYPQGIGVFAFFMFHAKTLFGHFFKLGALSLKGSKKMRLPLIFSKYLEKSRCE
jgi:hypothetical protein